MWKLRKLIVGCPVSSPEDVICCHMGYVRPGQQQACLNLKCPRRQTQSQPETKPPSHKPCIQRSRRSVHDAHDTPNAVTPTVAES